MPVKPYICMGSKPMAKKNYNRLKTVLSDLGITSKELADRIHKNPVTISRYCTNDQQPSLKVLYQIAEELQVAIVDLLEPNKYPSRKR